MGGIFSRLFWRGGDGIKTKVTTADSLKLGAIVEEEEGLPEVEMEEESLKGTVQELKGELEQVSKGNRLKLEEIRKLTRRIQALEHGMGRKVVMKKGAGSKSMETVEEAEMLIPEEVFPEEVWRIILGNMSDPKDLWNLTNTCQLFDTILSKWKTGWLLGQALPYLYQHLPGEKLPEARLVCRSWKESMDNFLGDHLSTRPHDPAKIDPARLDFVNPIKEKGLTRELMLGLEDWETMPFIGRYAQMFLEAGDADGEYKGLLDGARRYLDRFGKELWYLEIIIPGPDTIPDEAVHSNFIRFITADLLRLAPNLRRLDMTYMHETNVGFGSLPEIELKSIPDAPQLDTFLGYNTNHEDAMSEALLNRFHSQLRKLCLTASFWNRVRHLDWGNLTELHLTYIEDLEDLRCLQVVGMLRLSKLGLNLARLNRYRDVIPFDNLLGPIRELCQTTGLNTIRIDGGLHGFEIGQDVRNQDVTRAISTLEIDHDWGAHVPSYTFLLSCFPLVENIHLFMREPDDSNGPEIDLRPWEECLELAEKNGSQEVFEIVEVNKHLYRHQMYRSNIWELLPRLEVFSFQWDVYSRHGYAEYLERKEKGANASSNSAT